MAQRTVVSLVDDLDGTEANETVEYALDGVTYEMDLNDENAKQLREVFGPYISAARRTGGRRSTGGALPLQLLEQLVGPGRRGP